VIKVATNALKYLIDQLEERILQSDQLKNTSKYLQHRIDHTLSQTHYTFDLNTYIL